MYISRVTIDNIKGFRHLDLDFRRADGGLAGWTVLAGRNGSGKTTLLRALALGVAGPQAALRLMPDFRGWVRAAAVEATLDLAVEASDSFDVLDRAIPDPDPGPIKATLRWAVPRQTGLEPTLQADGSRENEDARRTLWGRTAEFGWFACGYGATRRVARSTEVPQTYDATSRVGSLGSLFREEASLEGAVGRLQQIYLRSLDTNLEARRREQASELLSELRELLNDGLLPDGVVVKQVDSRGLWVTQDGAELLLEDLSDGYRVVCALVIDLVLRLSRDGVFFRSRANNDLRPLTDIAAVVLIDEADLHLHISWQQKLGFWLKAHFPKVQFIVTSHSPFICQAADQIILLPPIGSEDLARPVSPEVFRSVVNGSVEDAVLSELFGLESSRSRQAEDLLRELSLLERKVRKQTATEEEARRYRELDARMPASADVDRAWMAVRAPR